jgi:3-ketosteroid 9alpha-monooxygenase subunit A
MARDTSLNGYPRGWFVVCFSDEIEVGDVHRMQYFGRELVAFRGESGEVSVLDAHCPHLGAHLGVGGTVQGDSVRCPFHAWSFGGDGVCTDIPYTEKIPRRARVRSFPVCERNGCVHIWYHEDAGEPTWEIPVIEEYGTPEWMPWSRRLLRIRTHPKEVMENVADKAHFPKVHRTEILQFENEYDAHRATQRTEGIATPPGGGTDHFKIEATYFGPGFQISHMDGVLESILILAHTPVSLDGGARGRGFVEDGDPFDRLYDGADHIDLRFGVSLRMTGGRSRTEKFSEMYLDNLRRGFMEDIEIWENKVFRPSPQLVPGDGPVGSLRRWYRQFYA